MRGTAIVIALSVFYCGGLLAAEVPSGLAVGERADQFLVKDCTGPAAGKTLCYYCRYGTRPVISLFVREAGADLGKLVEQIDRMVSEHRRERLAAFVVLIADDTRASEQNLRKLAVDHRIQHTPLTIYRDQAARLRDGYRLAPEAAVTLMMWREGNVRVSRGFASTRLEEAEIASFLAAVRRSLSE